mmetsp:Transcript_4691/g.8411  ORF Transcript_4691/g.8411 Transcript_4691/m.8411 type:complete len:317 (-) Transcript_4691:17-967(-)
MSFADFDGFPSPPPMPSTACATQVLGPASGHFPGQDDAWPADPFHASSPGHEDPFRTINPQPFDFGTDTTPTRFDMEERPKMPKQDDQQTMQELSRRFEKVLLADREICQQISDEMSLLEQELAQIQESAHQVEHQSVEDVEAKERLAGEANQLELQVADAQRRLLELRDDCRALNMESLSLRRDRNHLMEELTFLQRSLDDETQTLQSLEHMNSTLQAFQNDLESNAEILLHQRQQLTSQVNKERDLSKQDARQNHELRNLLERRRREQAACHSQKQLVGPHEAKVTGKGTHITSEHTWASFLSQSSSEKDKTAK